MINPHLPYFALSVARRPVLGNTGVTKGEEPAIFDPACYNGDEAVLAMIFLFGTFSKELYDRYEREWPVPGGFEQKNVIYNPYHIPNHYALFGGVYASQAQRMMGQILEFWARLSY
mmetsp:Transcript_1284/g.2729  ORF Transcript_1284/g.2729 Transcript_1284/m.2729 type:complete len:116 (-) Transcript_1284:252-599(-)|eukprot:CAMPEP_0172653250 /NCGR_PEP_ID=MMETSP1068-20121228/243731_1 /TAXON_ID=35684 /ORGANISM="Pseudopedinella elastica, Strain CCMP716" /LENGTH=115 /DNA_ID=CAMNT_0013467679 /DNA_START=516 /DNA_END=863 /DNA_ORIENTATION=-